MSIQRPYRRSWNGFFWAESRTLAIGWCERPGRIACYGVAFPSMPIGLAALSLRMFFSVNCSEAGPEPTKSSFGQALSAEPFMRNFFAHESMRGVDHVCGKTSMPERERSLASKFQLVRRVLQKKGARSQDRARKARCVDRTPAARRGSALALAGRERRAAFDEPGRRPRPARRRAAAPGRAGLSGGYSDEDAAQGIFDGTSFRRHRCRRSRRTGGIEQ